MHCMSILINILPWKKLEKTGRYHIFNDDKKSMNFIVNDNLLEKFYEKISDIESKLGVPINNFHFTNIHGTSLKTKVIKDKTCFRENNSERENILPRQNTNYICRILIRMESFFNNKDNKEDVIYYPQVFLEECRYIPMINRRLLLDETNLSDNEPQKESKSE